MAKTVIDPFNIHPCTSPFTSGKLRASKSFGWRRDDGCGQVRDIQCWQALVEAVGNDTKVPVSGDYGRHMIACIDAAMISARDQRDVNVAT